MKKSGTGKRKKVEFRLWSDQGKDVCVAGTFNDWRPVQMKLKAEGTGPYAVTVLVPPGRHEYKFTVDDVWQVDPENPETVPNAFGSMNSVVHVG